MSEDGPNVALTVGYSAQASAQSLSPKIDSWAR